MKEEIKNRKYILLWGDNFDIEFSSYQHLKDNNNEFKNKIEEFIYNNKLPIKCTGSTYRTINHWMIKGLIDDNRKKSNGWRKFNLMDILWIMIIIKLREFDYSINKILKIKKYIYDNKQFFEFNISKILFKKEELRLIVFDNGEADLISKSELPAAMHLVENENYISISFTSILEEVLKKKIEKKDMFIMPLNEKEKGLLIKIFKNGNSNFKIKTKNGKIKKFKQNKEIIEKINKTKNINIKELTKNNKNSRIIIDTNNEGKIVSIELEKNSD